MLQKTIDFTNPGGFPLTQDRLGDLQDAYGDAIGAMLDAVGHSGVGLALKGMEISPDTPSAGTVTVTDGIFWYNGQLVKFTGGTATPTGGDVVLVTITETVTQLTYNDTVDRDAITTYTANLTTGATVTDAENFPLLDLERWGNDDEWKSLVVSTSAPLGGVTGTIYYKKNNLTNTLQLRGGLTAANPGNFGDNTTNTFALMQTLPTGYRPSYEAFFKAFHNTGFGIPVEDAGNYYILDIPCKVNSLGEVFFRWLKSGVSAYAVNFNAILPLN